MSRAILVRIAVRALLGLGSGALLASAYQPMDLPALSIPAVAVFSAVVWSGTWRAGALAGVAFGLGFLGPLLWWLWASISPGAWLALVAVQAGWFALLGSAVATVRSLPGVTWWTAALWTAVEVLRSAWPLGGLPWGRLGFSALDTVWQGWLQWGGVSITTFVLALMGAATGRLVLSRGARAAPFGVAGLVAAASMAPAFAAKQPRAYDDAHVAIVQGGVPALATGWWTTTAKSRTTTPVRRWLYSHDVTPLASRHLTSCSGRRTRRPWTRWRTSGPTVRSARPRAQPAYRSWPGPSRMDRARIAPATKASSGPPAARRVSATPNDIWCRLVSTFLGEALPQGSRIV